MESIQDFNAPNEKLTPFANKVQALSNEVMTRDALKQFVERHGHQKFLDKLMEQSDTDTDAFIKNYLSLMKLVYPAQKAEDSRQKSLQIVINNSATDSEIKSNILPTPSMVDIPPINFKLMSPLDIQQDIHNEDDTTS